MIPRWLGFKRRKAERSRLEEFPRERRLPVDRLLTQLRDEKLTYVGPTKLRNLAWAALTVAGDDVPGDFVEAGVALGGTAILLGKLKPPGRKLILYDVFATIPAPGPEDGSDAHERYAEIASGKSKGLGDAEYYGYVEDLIGVVRGNLAKFGLTEADDRIEFVEGLFEQTLNPPGSVSLAHIDCDWYESVRVCIGQIYPLLSPGGIMVFDDYRSYSGCRKAVDEFLATGPQADVVFEGRSVGLRKRRPVA